MPLSEHTKEKEKYFANTTSIIKNYYFFLITTTIVLVVNMNTLFLIFNTMNAIKINTVSYILHHLVTDVQHIKRALRQKTIFSHEISSIKAFVVITTTNVERSKELLAKDMQQQDSHNAQNISPLSLSLSFAWCIL